MNKKEFTYKDAGVDIKTGHEMVESIKGLVRQTHGDEVLTGIGSFGGFFQPDLGSFSNPVFVSSVDGVGTKLIAAFKAKKYDTVGQDLVNHCVNDIAVCGAAPLFFMDYFSTGKLDKEVGYDVIKGFTTACKQNGVALIGGETAEMPDIYQKGEFDLAGSITGIVDKESIIDGNAIQSGDILLGFKSNGLHTNGYSLARKVLFSVYKIDDYVDEFQSSLAEELLAVHKSYLPVIRVLRDEKGLRGFSHITGGGIEGNTKRILPDGLSLQVDWDSWDRPPVFNLIQKLGNVPEDDMRQTFNLGIGLIAVVSPQESEQMQSKAKKLNEEIIKIGKVK